MTIQELEKHLVDLLNAGVDPNLPILYRPDGREPEPIEYSVFANDGKSILLAREWF